jgi:hypothetical protein
MERAKSRKARVAEWFKATDLRPVIIDAWVRTPPRAKQRISIRIFFY